MAGIFVGNIISHSVYRLASVELFDNPITRSKYIYILKLFYNI